ncbi:MAG: fibronectin type III domain-containing protein [Thermoplasmata archaeon]|nr:fibronectin type III domain-containing protein [Thermoplasmata archaeon]
MSGGRRTAAVLGCAVSLLVLASAWAPSAGSHGGLVARTPFAVSGEARIVGYPKAPAQPQGTFAPVAGQVYSPFNTTFAGVSQQSSFAVDPSRDVLYAISRVGGFLTVSNLSSGALLQSSILDANPVPGLAAWVALCFDPKQGVLFASFESSPNGSVWVVNASTLQVQDMVYYFGGTPQFEPGALAFDSPTGQLLVQDANEPGKVALVNTSTDVVRTVLQPCNTSMGPCVNHGILDVPTYGYALSLDGAPSEPAILLQAGVLGPVLQGSGAQFRLGPGLLDSSDNALWIQNGSTGARDVELFDAPSRAYLSDLAEPHPIPSMVFDAAESAVVLAQTASAPGDSLVWLNATTGSFVQNNSGASPPVASSSVIDGLTSADTSRGVYLLGGDSQSTWRYQLAPLGLPSFLLLGRLSEVPFQYGLAAGNGRVYSLSDGGDPPFGPGLLSAVNGTDGSLAWSVPTPKADGFAGQLGVDPNLGELFVASGGNSIAVYSAGSGSSLPGIATPNGTVGVAVDPSGSELFTVSRAGGSNTTVSAFTISANHSAPLWQEGIAPLPACAWTVDTAAGLLAIAGCGGGPGSDSVRLVPLAGTGTVRAWSTGSYPVAIASSPSGDLFVANFEGLNLSKLDPFSGLATSLPAPELGQMALAVDPSGRLLLAASTFSQDLSVLNASDGTPLGFVPATSALSVVAVDAGTGELAAGTLATDQLLLAPQLPPPPAVAGVQVVAGNHTLGVSWAPSTGSSGFPVLQYSVFDSLSNGSAAPWMLQNRTSTTGANLTGLVNGQRYYLQVRATAATGTGLGSSPVAGTPVGLPYPPTGVAVTALSDTALNVSWVAPSDNGGSSFIGFEVGWALDSFGPWVEQLMPASPSYVALSYLTPGTHYFVEVSAATAVGVGNPSPVVSAMTPAPSVPMHGPPPAEWLTALLLGAGALALGLAVVVIHRRVRVTPPRR